MSKKVKIFIISIVVLISSFSFTDSYFEIAKNLDIFTNVYRELNNYYVDETDPGKLMKTAIDKMLKSLDPYTNYIPESEIEDFQFMTTGQYGGIGAVITKRKDYVFISEPYEGFPAQKAGLIAGDKILEINGESAKGKNTEDVSKALKGQPNTEVQLLIERPYLEDPFSVSFKRQKISVKSVPFYSYLNESIGYIKLRSFTRNCSNDIKNAFLDLKKQGDLKGLILDLRANPGGLLNESVNIVNLFVEKGQEVVSTRGKIKSWDKVYNGRVLSLQSSDSDTIDTFHIYDIIPSDPQAFKKAHDYFVEKSGKNIWKGKQVAFGTYDLGRPNGATHWILTSGENERDIVKTYDIIQSDYSKELVKYLQDRGDVKDLKDFTVRNLGSYFNN